MITLSVAIAYHKYMMKLENAAIISFLSLPIIAIILQIIFYGVSFTNIAVVISTVILFVSYESYFAQYLVNKEKQVNEDKLRIVNRQMHPHFVFNSLALIHNRNSYAVNTALIDCDYYEYLLRKPEAKGSYRGQFMSQYSWAEVYIYALEQY